MQIASLILGIFSIVGFVFGFFPCLGWFNWFNIPVAIIGLIISIIAIADSKETQKGMSIAGLVCCSVAILFGVIRLVLGGGVI
jgi:hypothetical protein